MDKIKEGLEYEFGHWKEGDKYYKESTRNGKLVWKEVSLEEVNERIAEAERLAYLLEEGLDPVKILTEAIMRLPKKKVKQLSAALERDNNIVTRSHHCVDMKVGNFILPIVD